MPAGVLSRDVGKCFPNLRMLDLLGSLFSTLVCWLPKMLTRVVAIHQSCDPHICVALCVFLCPLFLNLICIYVICVILCVHTVLPSPKHGPRSVSARSYIVEVCELSSLRGSAFFFSIKSLFHRGSLEGICCIGDGDTGYGNAVNVKRTVRGYAQAGMAGLWANGWWIQDGRIRGLTATSLMIPPDVYIWISISGHPRIAVHVVCYIILLGLLCVQCRKFD